MSCYGCKFISKLILKGDAKTASAPPLGGLMGRAIGATGFPYSK